jgi:hypothetical protein
VTLGVIALIAILFPPVAALRRVAVAVVSGHEVAQQGVNFWDVA